MMSPWLFMDVMVREMKAKRGEEGVVLHIFLH